jgi:hypothetical protein
MKLPEGRCGSGPFFRSAMTCSMIACRRWSASAAIIGNGELVNTAWCRQRREQLTLFACHHVMGVCVADPPEESTGRRPDRPYLWM